MGLTWIGAVRSRQPRRSQLWRKLQSISWENKWAESIDTFTKTLLTPGLVNVGEIGELYIRIIFAMASDRVKQRMVTMQPVCDWVRARPFSLFTFLDTLLVHPLRSRLDDILLPFKSALLNFTHFSSVSHKLKEDQDSILELTHSLLYGQSALTCGAGQTAFDLFIPMYLGCPDSPFQKDELAICVIQVKNWTGRKSSGKLGVRTKDYSFLGINPILFIQFELGAPTPSVETEVLNSIHAIRISGRGASTFGFLDDREEAALEALAAELNPTLAGLEKAIVDGNKRYNIQRWGDRYPVLEQLSSASPSSSSGAVASAAAAAPAAESTTTTTATAATIATDAIAATTVPSPRGIKRPADES